MLEQWNCARLSVDREASSWHCGIACAASTWRRLGLPGRAELLLPRAHLAEAGVLPGAFAPLTGPSRRRATTAAGAARAGCLRRPQPRRRSAQGMSLTQGWAGVSFWFSVRIRVRLRVVGGSGAGCGGGRGVRPGGAAGGGAGGVGGARAGPPRGVQLAVPRRDLACAVREVAGQVPGRRENGSRRSLRLGARGGGGRRGAAAGARAGPGPAAGVGVPRGGLAQAKPEVARDNQDRRQAEAPSEQGNPAR